MLCQRHERGPRVSAELALPSGEIRGRATAALPQNLPTGEGVADGAAVRAIRDAVHGLPRAGGHLRASDTKSIAPSASQAIRHSCIFRSVAGNPVSNAYELTRPRKVTVRGGHAGSQRGSHPGERLPAPGERVRTRGRRSCQLADRSGQR
jgi:hypothetical protein